MFSSYSKRCVLMMKPTANVGAVIHKARTARARFDRRSCESAVDRCRTSLGVTPTLPPYRWIRLDRLGFRRYSQFSQWRYRQRGQDTTTVTFARSSWVTDRFRSLFHLVNRRAVVSRRPLVVTDEVGLCHHPHWREGPAYSLYGVLLRLGINL